YSIGIRSRERMNSIVRCAVFVLISKCSAMVVAFGKWPARICRSIQKTRSKCLRCSRRCESDWVVFFMSVHLSVLLGHTMSYQEYSENNFGFDMGRRGEIGRSLTPKLILRKRLEYSCAHLHYREGALSRADPMATDRVFPIRQAVKKNRFGEV